MENPYIKYLKTDKEDIYAFYTEDSNLITYEYKPLHSCPYKIIASNVVGRFSVSHYEGTTYITYYKNDGNLYVCTSKDNKEFTHTICMQNPKNFGSGKIFLVPMEDTCYMVYHIPTEINNIEKLVYLEYIDGIWQSEKEIDKLISNDNQPYYARRLSLDHIVFYYKTAKNLWNSKELLISSNIQSKRNTLFQSNAICVDISIINTSEKIHILYITKSMFRTQVIYQYKHTNAISPPRILWEGSYCQDCLAFLNGDKLNLMWRVNQVLMECISYDEGITFMPISRYSGAYPTKCEKGEFFSNNYNEFNSNGIYIDTSRGNLPFFP